MTAYLYRQQRPLVIDPLAIVTRDIGAGQEGTAGEHQAWRNVLGSVIQLIPRHRFSPRITDANTPSPVLGYSGKRPNRPGDVFQGLSAGI